MRNYKILLRWVHTWDEAALRLYEAAPSLVVWTAGTDWRKLPYTLHRLIHWLWVHQSEACFYRWSVRPRINCVPAITKPEFAAKMFEKLKNAHGNTTYEILYLTTSLHKLHAFCMQPDYSDATCNNSESVPYIAPWLSVASHLTTKSLHVAVVIENQWYWRKIAFVTIWKLSSFI